jgi:hypothetical protein
MAATSKICIKLHSSKIKRKGTHLQQKEGSHWKNTPSGKNLLVMSHLHAANEVKSPTTPPHAARAGGSMTQAEDEMQAYLHAGTHCMTEVFTR